MDFQQTLCPGCGQPKHESFDPDGPEYEATALQCRACAVRDEMKRAFQDDEHADTTGLFFVVSDLLPEEDDEDSERSEPQLS